MARKKNKDTRGSHAASIFCFYRDEQMYNRIDMTFWASSHTLVRFFGFDVLDNTTIGEMLGTSGWQINAIAFTQSVNSVQWYVCLSCVRQVVSQFCISICRSYLQKLVWSSSPGGNCQELRARHRTKLITKKTNYLFRLFAIDCTSWKVTCFSK